MSRADVSRTRPLDLRRESDIAVLVGAAQDGDATASGEIARRYRGLIRSRARSFFLIGAEREDVIQEGMVGLLKAIRDFDPSRQVSFSSFADLCVSRQILTAVKSAARRKHSPLNGYLPLWRQAAGETGDERVAVESLASAKSDDPAEIVLSAWENESIIAGLEGTLSGFETEVLSLYVAGKSYREIAEALGRDSKSVDNALQRTKRKIELQLQRYRV